MQWLLRLPSALQQAVIYGLIAIVVSLGITSGYLYVTKASVEVDLANTKANYATCSVNNTTLKASIEARNNAVLEEQRKAAAAKKEADAKLKAAEIAAGVKFSELERKYKDQVPSKPEDLCASAQIENAKFIREQK